MSNDMVYGRLVSTDGSVALIAASMKDDVFDEAFYEEIMDFAKSYNGDGDVIYVAGRPIVEGTMGMLGPQDMKRMVPVVMIVITLVLLLLLRSFRATLFYPYKCAYQYYMGVWFNVGYGRAYLFGINNDACDAYCHWRGVWNLFTII